MRDGGRWEIWWETGDLVGDGRFGGRREKVGYGREREQEMRGGQVMSGHAVVVVQTCEGTCWGGSVSTEFGADQRARVCSGGSGGETVGYGRRRETGDLVGDGRR
jgi:hypothetical protein